MQGLVEFMKNLGGIFALRTSWLGSIILPRTGGTLIVGEHHDFEGGLVLVVCRRS